jgi:tetratricopeptide (TPR) repeat protein
MKKTILFCISILTALYAPANAIDDSAHESIFYEAKTAYDEGRFAEAETGYLSLINNGWHNTELLYNLANAHFKNNHLPEAIKRYRQAWYQAPRDAAIHANLGFALAAANAVPPHQSHADALAESLSKTEWIILATAAYLLLAILLALAMLIRPARRFLLKTALIPLGLIAMAMAGWLHWRQLSLKPEAVIIRSGVTARYGPLADSTAHYRVPAGAIVRQIHTDNKGWTEIEYDAKRGWVPNEYIEEI